MADTDRNPGGVVLSGPWPGSPADRASAPATIRELRAREIRKAASVLRRSAERLRKAGDPEGGTALVASAGFLEETARQTIDGRFGA
jgi:hypothetical protein